MTTEITMPEATAPRELHAAAIIATRPFLPETDWAPLEEKRQRHERALGELREARREEALASDRHKRERRQDLAAAAGRVLDAAPAVDPGEREEARRRELEALGVRIRAAQLAARLAVVEALELIAAHGEWAAEVARRRQAAEAERAELLAKAEAARRVAHREDHLAGWLAAATKESPQPYSPAGPPPPPPATVADLFGGVAA